MARSRFQVVSTLGPASRDSGFIRACAALGQLRFRLNGSHLAPAELEAYLDLVAHSLPSARVCLDLQGDKRRIGALDAPRLLEAGAEVTLGPLAHAGAIPVPHPEILAAARLGDTFVLQDGAARLRVTRRAASGLRARVVQGAEIRGGCGIHLEGRSLGAAALPASQLQQLQLAAQRGVSELALSCVRVAAEITRLRAHCRALGYRPLIIAKLELPEAMRRLASICAAADEVWLCRGDLGALAPLASLGRLQERAVAAAAAAGRPILIAGQVLHHMTTHPEPTRSEVVHLHDIRRAGAAGIVLSDETAIGRDPRRVIEVVAEVLGSAALRNRGRAAKGRRLP